MNVWHQYIIHPYTLNGKYVGIMCYSGSMYTKEFGHGIESLPGQLEVIYLSTLGLENPISGSLAKVFL